MKKIGILIIALSIFGCVRKLPVEQGNIITPEAVHQLHIGMTQDEVKNIMGTPMVLNTFRDNRIDYVYTSQKGRDPMTEKRVTLIFENNRLRQIE